MSHPRAVGSILKNLRHDAVKVDPGSLKEEPQAVESSPSDGKSAGAVKHEPETGTPTGARKAVKRVHDTCRFDDFQMKKKRNGSKEEFSCYICNIECSSQTALDSHFAGKKHKKCLATVNEDIMSSASTEDKNVADIQERFSELSGSEPLVGLEYVIEYQKQDSRHRYFCEMCEFKTNCKGMLGHVTSRQHRLRFMRTHCFDVYHKITGYPTFKNMMLPSEADKLLQKQSVLLFHRLLNGKHCLSKVQQYKGEDDIKLDLRSFRRPHKVHPSQHKDLAMAEKILEEAEILEMAEQQGINLRRVDQVEPRGRLRDNPSHSRITAGVAASRPDASLERRDLIHELLEVEQLENELLRSKLNEKRLLDLDNQEHRICAAIRKLHQSVCGAEMTREENIADNKLLLLLGSIRAEKRRLLGDPSTGNESRVPKREISKPSLLDQRHEISRPSLLGHRRDISRPSLLGHRREISRPSLLGHRREISRPSLLPDPPFSSEPRISSLSMNLSGKMPSLYEVVRRKTAKVPPQPQMPVLKPLLKTPRGPSSRFRDINPDLSDVRKAVEPIIEETRQKVEEKIFEALSGGTLSSLIENFQRNPVLQASLKEWDQQQSSKRGKVSSGSPDFFTDSNIPSTSASYAPEKSLGSAKNLPPRSSATYWGEAASFNTINEDKSNQYSSNLQEHEVSRGFAGGTRFGSNASRNNRLGSMRFESRSRSYSANSGTRRQFRNSQAELKTSVGLLGKRPQFSGGSMKFHSGFY